MVDGDVVLQWNQPMNESTLSGQLNSLGLIYSWLHSMFAHRFRYGGGKMLNESGWFFKQHLTKVQIDIDPCM